MLDLDMVLAGSTVVWQDQADLEFLGLYLGLEMPLTEAVVNCSRLSGPLATWHWMYTRANRLKERRLQDAI